MLKYLKRLENMHEGLLFDAFICNKDLHSINIPTWYSAALLCSSKLKVNVSQVNQSNVAGIIQTKLCKQFLNFWTGKQMQYRNSTEGKLDTYFKLKDCFKREKYLDLKEFNDRQIISKIRLSAHSLKIETGRYGLCRLDRADRTCDLCDGNNVESEVHFSMECPMFSIIRSTLFEKITNNNNNFTNLSAWSKFVWLCSNENLTILKPLSSFLNTAMNIRKEKIAALRTV